MDWATPTPLPTAVGTPHFDIGVTGEEAAESIVQGYQFLNMNGVLDIGLTSLIIIIAIVGFWSVTKHFKALNDG